MKYGKDFFKNFFCVYKQVLLSIFIITVLWALLHIFSLSWGLPNFSSLESDAVPAQSGIDATEMMRRSAYNYPPLQYMILDKAAASLFPAKQLKESEEILRNSERIWLFRFISALMSLGISFSILTISWNFFRTSITSATLAALLFQLLPVCIFHSHASNMDIPYTFWFTLALTFIIAAETFKEKHKTSLLLVIPAGIFLGASFCTKDMIYAWCILPSMLYFILKYRASKGFTPSIVPFIVLGISFLTAVALIYLAAGGKEVFLNHFLWITGEQPMTFAQKGTGIGARAELFLLQLYDSIKALDAGTAMLVILSIFCAVSCKNEIPQERLTIFKYTLLFLCAMLISENLFYVQVTRSNYPRFFLPAIPIICILVFLLWDYFKKAYKIIFIALLIFQFLIALQYIYSLVHDPRTELRDFLKQNINMQNLSIAIDSSNIADKYAFINGRSIALKSIRFWGQSEYGVLAEKQKSIILDSFHITMADPDLIITKEALSEDKSKLLARNKYRRLFDFKALPVPVFTLFSYSPPEISVYGKTADIPIYDKDFQNFENFSFAEQLMRTTCLIDKDIPTTRQTELFSRVLAPFSQKDLEGRYLIYPNAFIFAFNAYEAAGRFEDAGRLGVYLLGNSREDALIKTALSFFMKHPEEATKNSLSIKHEKEKISWKFE